MFYVLVHSIKSFFQFCFHLLQQSGRTLALVFSLILAGSVVLTYSQGTSLFVTHRAIVEAHDNDAGAMVEVARKTHWWNDNGFRYYGPAYFRIARTFSYGLSPLNDFLPQKEKVSLTPALQKQTAREMVKESMEKSLHFSLMMISVLSIFGISFILASTMTTVTSFRFVISSFLFLWLINTSTWAEFTLMAHPDHLLSFFTLAGFYFFILYQFFRFQYHYSFSKDLFHFSKAVHQENRPKPDSKWKSAHAQWADRWGKSKDLLVISALFFGLACATKLSALFFAPGIFLLTYFLEPKKIVENAMTLFLWGFGAYLVIGFPQSLDLVGYIQKMTRLSEFSGTPSIESFISWFDIVRNQLMILPIMVIAILLFGSRSQRFSQGFSAKGILLFFIFGNLGLLILALRKLDLVHHHYVFPFVGVLCLSIILVGLWLRSLIFSKLKSFDFWTEHNQGKLVFICMLLFPMVNAKVAPQDFKAALHHQMMCRQDYESLYTILFQEMLASKNIVSTPYVPAPEEPEQKSDSMIGTLMGKLRGSFAPSTEPTGEPSADPTLATSSVTEKFPYGKVKIDWEMNLEKLSQKDVGLFVANKSYYGRYLIEASDYVKKTNSEYLKSQEFYRQIANSPDLTDLAGRHWIKRPQVYCGVEIWQLQSQE